MTWTLQLPRGTLALDRPIVMGVVNVTPDSFSDTGRHHGTAAAAAHGARLAAAGAAIIDVGGESTRPGATPVGDGEELRRVIPVIEALVDSGLVVSIDTRHAEVARHALEHGASIVNDVSGLRHRAMRSVIAEHGVPAVIMHAPVDDPATMQHHAEYVDVVASVVDFLRRQIELARADGIDQVVVDPGIGFGKTTFHNLELIRRLDELAILDHPVLVGASRKRFIGEVTAVDRPEDRLAGTLAVHLACLSHGARILRAHDVAEHVQAVRVWEVTSTKQPPATSDAPPEDPA